MEPLKMTVPFPFISKQDLPERVTLVTPPSIFLLDQRVFMNLGILKVGAMLEQYGVKVEHLDLSGVGEYVEALAHHLKQTPSKHIGITVTTPQLPLVVPLILKIRQLRPDMKIILGGPHITLTCSAVKLEKKAGRISRAHQALSQLQSHCDVLVSGDGELSIFRALQNDSPKIVDGDEQNGPFFLTNALYEKTPFPARHLADVNSYHYSIEGHKSTSLIAQLGCPFACGFCGGRNSKSLRVIRTRSSQSIVDEIRHLYHQYGFTGFMFYDDELNVNKKMIELMNCIADLQSELGVEFRLRGFVKSELFNEDQAKAMYRAGFRWILSGFESGAPRILENINKKATCEDNTRTVEIAHKYGLKVKALMSVGHPGETLETITQTQEWLLKVKPDEFDCTVITTYPGTPYYDEAVPHPTLPNVWTYTYAKTGDQLHAYEVDFLTVMDHYKGDPKGGYKSFVFTDALPAEEIVKLRNWVEDSVRAELALPFPGGAANIQYEHSMGQGVNHKLPETILKESKLPKSGGDLRFEPSFEQIGKAA